MSRLAAFASALPLAACAAALTPETAAVPAGECKNDGLAQFIGQPATSEVGAAILRHSRARQIQWIGPDEMVTMEFRSDRVRVRRDAANRIVSARCG